MAQLNAVQKRARDILKMLTNTKDHALRRKRTAALPPIVIKMSELSPTAYCALMQMRGALPSATPEQLEAAQRVFGSVIDRATQVAAVLKGLQELDEMGIGVFMPPSNFFCYPNLDLATEVVTPAQLKS